MNKKIKYALSIAICILFIATAFSGVMTSDIVNVQSKSMIVQESTIPVQLKRDVTATITCRESVENIVSSLQPVVVITSPPDGATVTDPHLVVLGYAADEAGMNYWEWIWEWETGSRGNSSYFDTANYVEFRIDIYGLQSGWNKVTVTFKNIYGYPGYDSVTVTYVPPNNPPNTPTQPEGPTSGNVGESLHFESYFSDPDGDSMDVMFDWGDGTDTGWIGVVASGTTVGNYHSYDEPGTYQVRTKARDLPYLTESDWSEPLIVSIYPEEDTIPPTTTKIVGEPNYEKWYGEYDGYDWYVTSETPFTLTASDAGSGVAGTYYRTCYIDTWSNWTEYREEPFYLVGDGPHYIEFYSVDYAGNIEETHNQTHYVDTVPPIVYLMINGSKHNNDYAFICVGANRTINNKEEYVKACDNWVLAGLHAYFVLLLSGYDPSNIYMILADGGIDRTKVIKKLNDPNGKFSTKGKITKDLIETMEKSKSIYDDEMVQKNKKKNPNIRYRDLFYAALGWFKDEIITDATGQKPPVKVTVTFYFVSHGTETHQFRFPDDNLKAKGGAIEQGVISADDWKEQIYTLFEKPLNENNPEIKCEKILLLYDFCHSGGYVDALDTSKPVNKNKIAVSSSSSTEKSKYCDELGSIFFCNFWKNIQGNKGVQFSYNQAKNYIYNGKTVDAIQHPQMKPIPLNPDFVLLQKDPINSRSEISLNAVDDVLCDIPVGVDNTRYRIDNGAWETFTETFTLSQEGTHTVECYSVDLLGNTGNIDKYNILVDDTPPDIPNLQSPKNNEETTSLPTFTWIPVTDESQVYITLQIATDATFSNIVFEKTRISGSMYPLKEDEVLPIGSHYWRLKAFDGVGNSDSWSEIESFIVNKDNSPPDKPDKPAGPTSGKLGVEYTYTAVGIDPDDDRVCYIIDWGDGSFDFIGLHDSGETISASHSWSLKGDYSIKVLAEDEHGQISEWSDPLSIIMPKNKNIGIETPKQGYLYIFGKEIIPLRKILIIGSITIGINGFIPK